MPELPEVETMRRGLTPIVGRRVRGVDRPPCRRRPILVAPRWPALRRRMTGRTISAVSRLGKRVVIELDDDQRLVIEPRMTGLVLLTTPPTVEHLRLRISFSAGRQDLLFWDRRGLGTVRLFTAKEFAAEFGRRIGPDALLLTADVLRERLAGSRREIKVALLDQKAIAGIGNLYASEILHLAGINPRRRCDQLRGAEWPPLHAAIQEVLEAAIRHEGSTLSDGTYRNALNQNGGYQNHHRVYDRAGEACATCGRGNIARIVQAQRSTFFCPKCQTPR
jgi:formamidopyrimidine-DNA glycosylase